MILTRWTNWVSRDGSCLSALPLCSLLSPFVRRWSVFPTFLFSPGISMRLNLVSSLQMVSFSEMSYNLI